MYYIICLILLVRIDHGSILKDHYDMIEVNHYYNDYGSERWTQLIMWDRIDNKYHVQKWVMMKDAYTKSEAHQKKYEKNRRKIADKIKDRGFRRDFLDHTHYIGEFTGGKYYPHKLHKTGIWVVLAHDGRWLRRITADQFSETHTLYDPELLDRKEYDLKFRRGWRLPSEPDQL